jgi:CheY-like chemotaxis protein
LEFVLGLTELKVLIVDDQTDMLRLLKGILLSFGVRQVEEARDGEEALFLLRHRHPGFVITDWEMEPMDGYTFAFHTRNIRHGEDAMVPIIMMSAHAEPTRIKAARKLGVAQFILKPIVPHHLKQRMMWVLEHPIRYVQQGEQYVPVEEP